jgi:hypothetical protein
VVYQPLGTFRVESGFDGEVVKIFGKSALAADSGHKLGPVSRDWVHHPGEV